MPPPAIRHAPLGAQASFDFGPPGAPAGFAQPSSLVPDQQVIIGCRHTAGEPWALLPFFKAWPDGPAPLAPGRFGRFLTLAGDKWMIGPLVFKIFTPLPTDARETTGYAAHVCGYLEYDNAHGEEAAELIFAVGGTARAIQTAELVGSSFGDTCGFATRPANEVSALRDGAILGGNQGDVTGLVFRVPAQSRRIYPLVLGFFNRDLHAAEALPDLNAVLGYGLKDHARCVASAEASDVAFMRSPAPFDAKTRAAVEVRAWLAQSRRLRGEPEIDLAPLRQTLRGIAD